MILGTPHYMAPEQARSEGVDHRADIYALGVMMYRAFTGKLPFTAESTIGVITRHATEAPEPPSHFMQIDQHLEGLILRCMAKRPQERPQRMADVSRDLRAIAMKSSGYGWPMPNPAHAPYTTGSMPVVTGTNLPVAAVTGNMPGNMLMGMQGSMQMPMPPSVVPESATQGGIATSHTGMVQAPARPRSGLVLLTMVIAALVTGGLGAVLAFGLFRGGSEATQGATTPAPMAPAAPSPEASSASAEPAPSASAEPSAEPSASAATTAAAPQATSRAGSSVRTSSPQPRPSATTKSRRPEIRSPFE